MNVQNIINFDLSKRIGSKRIQEFADYLIDLQNQIDFKISARGWGYYLESERVINKDQFDKVENAINRCRKRGFLPVDFIAEDSPRLFKGVETPSVKEGKTVESVLKWMLSDVLGGNRFYTPDWWEGEKYYIQVVVEKIDLMTLFEPITSKYHIPIATSKGWSSIIQRAKYADRFKKAEAMGLECILLYCGDHDPDGLRISDFMRKNLEDIRHIYWTNGERGYNPAELKIERFGLSKKLITKHKLTWIDNLITGSGKNLASKSHKNFKMPYVQDYLKKFGERKCEANAIIPKYKIGRQLMEDTIVGYLGKGALQRFADKREVVRNDYEGALKYSGISTNKIKTAMKKLDKKINKK